MTHGFAVLQREALFDVWPVQGILEETNGKTGHFALRNMGEIKQEIFKFAKPCHQAL